MSENNQPYDWANPVELTENDNQTDSKTGVWQSFNATEKRTLQIVAILAMPLLILEIYWSIASPLPDHLPNESVAALILACGFCYLMIRLMQRIGRVIYQRLSLNSQQRLKSIYSYLLD